VRRLLAVLGFLFILAAVRPDQPVRVACEPGATVVVDGFERAHRCVSRDAAAQTDFDDGLTLLYAFDPTQARRAFERAAHEDPHLAMAWWGVANTYAPNINMTFDAADHRRGREAIARALPLRDDASPAERALIDATVKRFADVGTKGNARAARAYRDAMVAAARAFAHDDDIRALAAEAEMDVHPWSYFTADGKPTPGTLDLIAQIRAVLERTPDHIGAEHFAIHAFEESTHPEEALDAARRLAARHFETGAEHLTHMPAHTFMRVGLYHEAGEANARAVASFSDPQNPPRHNDYFGHDCQFGVDAFLMSGEANRARTLAAACKSSTANYASQIDFRFADWPALARDAGSSDFASGMVAAHAKRVTLAQQHLHALRTTTDDVTSIKAALLEARIARASGNATTEIAALERAVTSQDALGYAEPPTFFYPVRESLGAALVRAGKFGEAERVFRDDLTRDRENPRALFGLSEALARAGRNADARAARERFDRA